MLCLQYNTNQMRDLQQRVVSPLLTARGDLSAAATLLFLQECNVRLPAALEQDGWTVSTSTNPRTLDAGLNSRHLACMAMSPAVSSQCDVLQPSSMFAAGICLTQTGFFGPTRTVLISVYLPPLRTKGKTSQDLRECLGDIDTMLRTVKAPFELVVAGDFNLPKGPWQPNEAADNNLYDSAIEILLDWMNARSMSVVTPQGSVTYEGHQSNRVVAGSTLDLLFARHDVTDYHIVPDNGRDHFPVFFRLGANLEPCANICAETFYTSLDSHLANLGSSFNVSNGWADLLSCVREAGRDCLQQHGETRGAKRRRKTAQNASTNQDPEDFRLLEISLCKSRAGRSQKAHLASALQDPVGHLLLTQPHEQIDLLVRHHFPQAGPADLVRSVQLSSFFVPSTPSNDRTASQQALKVDELDDALDKLDISLPPGADGLSAALLKELCVNSVFFKRAIYQLCQYFLKTGTAPCHWSKAFVAFVPKPGLYHAQLPDSYLPRILPCAAGLLMEWIICQRLEHDLSARGYFDQQFKLTDSRSVEHGLLQAIDTARNAMKLELQVAFLSIQTAPALDVSSLARLHKELSSVGMDSLPEWIISWLQKRTFRVKVSDVCSESMSSDRVAIDFGCPVSSSLLAFDLETFFKTATGSEAGMLHMEGACNGVCFAVLAAPSRSDLIQYAEAWFARIFKWSSEKRHPLKGAQWILIHETLAGGDACSEQAPVEQDFLDQAISDEVRLPNGQMLQSCPRTLDLLGVRIKSNLSVDDFVRRKCLQTMYEANQLHQLMRQAGDTDVVRRLNIMHTKLLPHLDFASALHPLLPPKLISIVNQTDKCLYAFVTGCTGQPPSDKEFAKELGQPGTRSRWRQQARTSLQDLLSSPDTAASRHARSILSDVQSATPDDEARKYGPANLFEAVDKTVKLQALRVSPLRVAARAHGRSEPRLHGDDKLKTYTNIPLSLADLLIQFRCHSIPAVSHRMPGQENCDCMPAALTREKATQQFLLACPLLASQREAVECFFPEQQTVKLADILQGGAFEQQLTRNDYLAALEQLLRAAKDLTDTPPPDDACVFEDISDSLQGLLRQFRNRNLTITPHRRRFSECTCAPQGLAPQQTVHHLLLSCPLLQSQREAVLVFLPAHEQVTLWEILQGGAFADLSVREEYLAALEIFLRAAHRTVSGRYGVISTSRRDPPRSGQSRFVADARAPTPSPQRSARDRFASAKASVPSPATTTRATKYVSGATRFVAEETDWHAAI